MIWLLLACGRNPVSAFHTARIEAVCAWHDRCETFSQSGYKDAEDCRQTLASANQQVGEAECEDFSQGSADACVAVWDEGPCGAALDLSVCEDVCQ